MEISSYVIVFQDFLTKWPMVFATSDQKAYRVPECLLSDRGTNMLSHLMKNIFDFLGTTKLNIIGYHPQCDGMVERFNQTLITMLRKHADKIMVSSGIDTYLEYCGHIEIRPTSQLVKNYLICYLGVITDNPWKPLCWHPQFTLHQQK